MTRPIATADVVVLTCSCGNLPLDQAMHATAGQAWTAAAAHVALNPTLCNPSMHRDSVPVALAPRSTR